MVYGDYFSIFNALKRSTQHGSVCNTLSLEEKFSYEKVHDKHCKSVLGLKKTACSISAKSELDRFPISSKLKLCCIFVD